MGAQGEHPKHRGLSDAGLLGTVERYFTEIMPIPRLQQRIDCFIFTRSFEPALQRVSRLLDQQACCSRLLWHRKASGFRVLARQAVALNCQHFT